MMYAQNVEVEKDSGVGGGLSSAFLLRSILKNMLIRKKGNFNTTYIYKKITKKYMIQHIKHCIIWSCQELILWYGII